MLFLEGIGTRLHDVLVVQLVVGKLLQLSHHDVQHDLLHHLLNVRLPCVSTVNPDEFVQHQAGHLSNLLRQFHYGEVGVGHLAATLVLVQVRHT